MEQISSILQSQSVVYVTRDIERALGLPADTPGYSIIANAGTFANAVKNDRTDIHLLPTDTSLDTYQLLQNTVTQNLLPRGANILVFKNTPFIEKICRSRGWRLLNPPAKLGNQIEEKISQISWLGELARYLPEHRVLTCEKITWSGRPFVVQFNHAHSGGGTILITNPEQLAVWQKQFPKREARLLQYISGPVFTNNNVVTSAKTLIGNISYQITGLPPFTDRPFATIGNDWGLPQKLLSATQYRQYREMIQAIGDRLRQDGWRGLFGVDIIMDEKTGQLYLLEINARQPASTTFESQRQLLTTTTTDATLTTFAAHIAALLGVGLEKNNLIPIKDGAQIILRRQKNYATREITSLIKELEIQGLTVIPYDNPATGSEWLRIQSPVSLLSAPGILNTAGKKIRQTVQLFLS
ncbi:MAG: hypothetical protein HY984_01115 [Candidatus Magasanikbacteria bacterium]|nr:hypothetical protein [Candidatus Magasanikbacteria bacterium]